MGTLTLSLLFGALMFGNRAPQYTTLEGTASKAPAAARLVRERWTYWQCAQGRSSGQGGRVI
jgi:hypothetical protein